VKNARLILVIGGTVTFGAQAILANAGFPATSVAEISNFRMSFTAGDRVDLRDCQRPTYGRNAEMSADFNARSDPDNSFNNHAAPIDLFAGMGSHANYIDNDFAVTAPSFVPVPVFRWR